jgi:hypothetical protein
VEQASGPDGLALDGFGFVQDDLRPSMMSIGWRDLTEALMVTAVVAMLDEGSDVPFEVSRKAIVFEHDAVFQHLLPVLDFSGHRAILPLRSAVRPSWALGRLRRLPRSEHAHPGPGRPRRVDFGPSASI